MGPTVDGDLIKDHLAYPKSWNDEVYWFFRSIGFMSGTLDGEGSMVYMMLSTEIQVRFNLNILQYQKKVPLSLLCQSFAPSYVQTVAGNFPEHTKEICELYTTSDGDDKQSRRVTDFQTDLLYIVPSNIMLEIHAENNSQAKKFQYLITKPTPYPFFQEPPSWLTGAGHGEDLHLLFGVTSDHVPEETLKKHDLGKVKKLSKYVINYWSDFTKTGDPNSGRLPNCTSFDTLSKKYAILDTPIKEGENLKANATDLLKRVISEGRSNFPFNEGINGNSQCSSHSVRVCPVNSIITMVYYTVITLHTILMFFMRI